MEYSKFIENLKSLIEARGMTPHGFAMDCKISPATISRYLSGLRAPEIKYVIMISKYFGVSIDWLLGVGEDKYQGVTEADNNLINAYKLASETDKLVVDTVLKKYKK